MMFIMPSYFKRLALENVWSDTASNITYFNYLERRLLGVSDDRFTVGALDLGGVWLIQARFLDTKESISKADLGYENIQSGL